VLREALGPRPSPVPPEEDDEEEDGAGGDVGVRQCMAAMDRELGPALGPDGVGPDDDPDALRVCQAADTTPWPGIFLRKKILIQIFRPVFSDPWESPPPSPGVGSSMLGGLVLP